MISILAEASSGSFLSDYTGLLREPAHYAFEFTVNAIEIIVTAVIARPLWSRYKARVERRAVRRHDEQYHPVCTEDFEDTMS